MAALTSSGGLKPEEKVDCLSSSTMSGLGMALNDAEAGGVAGRKGPGLAVRTERTSPPSHSWELPGSQRSPMNSPPVVGGDTASWVLSPSRNQSINGSFSDSPDSAPKHVGSPSWVLSPAARSLEDSVPRTSPSTSEENYNVLALRSEPEPSPERSAVPGPSRPLAPGSHSPTPAFPFILDVPGNGSPETGSRKSVPTTATTTTLATSPPSPTVAFRDFFGEETLTRGLGSLMREDAASLERAASSISTKALVATTKSATVISPTPGKRRPATALPAISESPIAQRRAAAAAAAEKSAAAGAPRAEDSPIKGRLTAVRNSGARNSGILALNGGDRSAASGQSGPGTVLAPQPQHAQNDEIQNESRIRGAPPARSANTSPTAGLIKIPLEDSSD